MDKETLNTYIDELGTTLGEALLAPTRIYVGALKSIKNAGVRVKACSHITGGGFYENIPRMLPEGKHAVVEKNSYPVPPIFTLMAREGNVDEHMMYNTYNMHGERSSHRQLRPVPGFSAAQDPGGMLSFSAGRVQLFGAQRNGAALQHCRVAG